MQVVTRARSQRRHLPGGSHVLSKHSVPVSVGPARRGSSGAGLCGSPSAPSSWASRVPGGTERGCGFVPGDASELGAAGEGAGPRPRLGSVEADGRREGQK